MKKLIPVLVCMLVFATVSTVASAMNETRSSVCELVKPDLDRGRSSQWLWGDANNDGAVTPADALLIHRYVYSGGSSVQLPPINFEKADVDDDGKLTRIDRNIVFALYMGDVEQWECPLKVLLGDANDSGIVTIGDLVRTINYILYGPFEEQFNFWNADVDADGQITYDDVNLISDYLLELIDHFPAEQPQFPIP